MYCVLQVKHLPKIQQAWAITFGFGWNDYVYMTKDSRILKRKVK